ncbi:MAG TPA: sigma 54-interacting transcriptional regulator [Pyrinomonadaceae bacterium]|nr:sigma 54-interacting transcriptional regulator [Pyrinomonadaceae bacterium]
MSKEKDKSDNAVIDLEHARVRLRSRAKATPESLNQDLEGVRGLLDQGLTIEARTRLNSLLSEARNQPELLAEARRSLSIALEMQGNYRESLEAVAMYEAPEARTKLNPTLGTLLRVQIALANNYNGDHPKAISLLKATLRGLPEEGVEVGAVYAALARVYRSISEYPIGRDYSHRALECYRQTGDWRGLAEAYFGLGSADIHEGQHEASLENFGQALKLVGDHPAAFLLGKIYSNMAGACWFMKRPQEGIRFLEKAISYYERTDHKNNAADGYNNLGMNLVLIGQWDRAQEALERALSIASETGEHGAQVSMILDSLGELLMLRGDFEEACTYLGRAVTLSAKNGNRWYEGQAQRTLGRCYVAMKRGAEALTTAKKAQDLAEEIGDRQAICESHLLLAEACLECGDTEGCGANLDRLAQLITDSPADLLLAGEAQRLHGLLTMASGDASTAAQHFGRSVSIFDLLGDRYRSARAHLELGRAYAIAQPERAAEHLTRAVNIFRELGAHLNLSRAEEAAAALDQTTPQQLRKRETVVQLLTLRLAEAVASRELLLRELAAVVRQETSAGRVVIIEPDEGGRQRVVIAHGCSRKESEAWAEDYANLKKDSRREAFARKHNVAVVNLSPSNAPPATLLISPRDSAELSGGLSLEPLLRVVELGMDVCALRVRTRSGPGAEEESALAGASLMPGFIHSSPAMTRLVEEVHKIRSSDVTVLVTGESGTGKELVARAIHALSSRRDKIFVPFNCTAVPRELSEGYLFGYRRGAFTGAVKDSAGVIRTALGGTLFLDEIGDLPLDVQPKLLRFLQEGEIQPLGEQRPIKVDVRIIAATNTDLEEMVAQGRFREDLYYRLNVIRLRVPPLRERRSEIPTIVNYYVNHYAAKFSRRDIQIEPQAIDLLMVAEWPGNVRQLCNEMQRVIARAEDGTLITPEHLSPELRHMSSPTTPPGTVTSIGAGGASMTVPIRDVTLADALAEVERRMIAEALRKHNGNISRAARELGLTRRGLYLKLERHAMSASA